MQEESKIYVYLKGSYYDCITSKGLDEREQLLAKALGETSIEEVIKNKFNNNREEYEKGIQEDTGLPYEIGLNSMLVGRKVISDEEYATYYIENGLNLKTDEEKEKEVINLIKEIDKEDITIEELRESINEQVNSGEYSTETECLDWTIWDYYNENELLKLKLITPRGEEKDLSYSVQDYFYEFNILGNINYISNDNTVKFIAKNHRGKTAELIIPIKMRGEWKTFKIKISDSDIRKYAFIEGQTWEEFIGNNMSTESGNYISKREDGSTFENYSKDIRYYNEEIYTWVGINTETGFNQVVPTDKIIADTVYEVEEIRR